MIIEYKCSSKLQATKELLVGDAALPLEVPQQSPYNYRCIAAPQPQKCGSGEIWWPPLTFDDFVPGSGVMTGFDLLTMSTPAASVDMQLDVPGGNDPAAGAIAVFVGTTRNSFKGRVVSRLEYQAYSKLAIKTIADILRDAQGAVSPSLETSSSSISALLHCMVYHRLGNVSIGEPSIVIACSSPHRKEAFVACERILEGVKDKAQIWKREWFEGEQEDEALWKSNRA